MSRRIGIYSGTFDPVHKGHIAFAQKTAKVRQLDEVWLLPEKSPRAKWNASDISYRLRLLEKATTPSPNLHTVQLAAEQFEVRTTLAELRNLCGDAELTLLIGSDVAKNLMSWPDIDFLLNEMSLAIGIRAGDSREEILTLLAPTPITFIETSFSHLSSSQLRPAVHLAATGPTLQAE